MSNTPIVWVMTQYLEDETNKPAHCSVVAKLEYDILEAELAACSDAFDRQQEQLDRHADQLASKQAKIDSLMFEYCPEEITEEQFNEWKKHQQPVKEEGK
jgi:hypothetical protein